MDGEESQARLPRATFQRSAAATKVSTKNSRTKNGEWVALHTSHSAATNEASAIVDVVEAAAVYPILVQMKLKKREKSIGSTPQLATDQLL